MATSYSSLVVSYYNPFRYHIVVVEAERIRYSLDVGSLDGESHDAEYLGEIVEQEVQCCLAQMIESWG